MGFANKYLASLRKIGRKVILSSDKIIEILESHIDFSSVKNIIDFGAGTLYWSEYFASKLNMVSDSAKLNIAESINFADSNINFIDSNTNRGGGKC